MSGPGPAARAVCDEVGAERLRAVRSARRPLRIALFSGNYNYTVDGANRTLNRLVEHLQATRDAQVRIYSPTTSRPAFPPAGDLVSVPAVPIPFRTDYRLALGMPPRIRADIEVFRPDLVHVSAPDLLGTAAQHLARRLNVPVVATLHTHFDTYLEYYGLSWLRGLVQRRLLGFYDACDVVLAPTPAIAEELRGSNLRAQIRVWPRGVDLALFSPARRDEAWRRRHGFGGHRPVVAFIGRIVMEKGLAVFVEAIRRLEARGAAPHVLVVGDGPARAWFAEQMPRAVFTGFLTGEALATAIASSDILLNPSRTETFGNVNLEAMASGLALVCADVPNTRALLEHDVSGLLCAPADAGAYADAVGALVCNPVVRSRLAREAHRLSAAYRWPEILDLVGDVYDEAVTLRRLPELDRGCEAAGPSARAPRPRGAFQTAEP